MMTIIEQHPKHFKKLSTFIKLWKHDTSNISCENQMLLIVVTKCLHIHMSKNRYILYVKEDSWICTYISGWFHYKYFKTSLCIVDIINKDVFTMTSIWRIWRIVQNFEIRKTQCFINVWSSFSLVAPLRASPFFWDYALSFQPFSQFLLRGDGPRFWLSL